MRSRETLSKQTSSRKETLASMILRVLGELGVPIVLGFPSGHVESGNITLPFGVPAVLLALSADSPFWRGRATGLLSTRLGWSQVFWLLTLCSVFAVLSAMSMSRAYQKDRRDAESV